MTSSSHIAILGAGLIGLSTADALLRRGQRVTLIDVRDRPMQGTSFANSGMIHPSQAISWTGGVHDPEVDAAVRMLALHSRDLLQNRMSEFGLEAMRTNPPGCFQLFESIDEADAVLARMRADGLSADSVPPGRLPFDRPALYYADDRWGDARDYGMALLASVQARGAILQSGCRTSLKRIETDRGVEARLTVNGQLFEADQIVIATGAESVSLMSSVSLTLPIRPVKGWAVDFARPEPVELPDRPVMDSASRSALTPFADRVRLSGTMGKDSPAALIERWSQLMPELNLQQKDFDLIWSGERPVSELGRPFIDRTPLSNLWIHAGHGHMGWTLCAGSADSLVKHMIDNRPTASFAYPSER